MNSVLIAEAIRPRSSSPASPSVDAADVRRGLERLDLTDARLKELGLEGSCRRSRSPAPTTRARIGLRPAMGRDDVAAATDWFAPMTKIVRPMLGGCRRRVRQGQPAMAQAYRALQTDRLGAGPASASRAGPGAAAAEGDRDERRGGSGHARGQQHRGGLRPRDPGPKGVTLTVPLGAIVALLGANGAGKTTTLKAVSNLLRAERGEVTRGSILLAGRAVQGLPPSELVARGCVQVMEGRHCFGHLTVEENLLTGAYTRKDGPPPCGRPRAGLWLLPAPAGAVARPGGLPVGW